MSLKWNYNLRCDGCGKTGVVSLELFPTHKTEPLTDTLIKSIHKWHVRQNQGCDGIVYCERIRDKISAIS